MSRCDNQKKVQSLTQNTALLFQVDEVVANLSKFELEEDELDLLKNEWCAVLNTINISGNKMNIF